MTPEAVMTIGKDAIVVLLMISVPILLAGMAVGLLVSIFQAVTQIQEMTLTFVPKIIVVFLALIALFPWMIQVMLNYTTELMKSIPQMVG